MDGSQETGLKATLEQLNQQLRESGLPCIDVVPPADCIPQDVNARYMDQQMMQNLVANLKRDGRLESVPLVARSIAEPGKYEIISGHHRIEAAKQAGLASVMVMVTEADTQSQVRAKQLSHNAINGRDDEAVLKQLYEQIEELDLKYYSGLQTEIDKITLTGMNFRAGSFREVVLTFVPGDLELMDEAVELVQSQALATSQSAVRLCDMKSFDVFAKALRQVKKVENIKNNGMATARLAELAMERLRELAHADAGG